MGWKETPTAAAPTARFFSEPDLFYLITTPGRLLPRVTTFAGQKANLQLHLSWYGFQERKIKIRSIYEVEMRNMQLLPRWYDFYGPKSKPAPALPVLWFTRAKKRNQVNIEGEKRRLQLHLL